MKIANDNPKLSFLLSLCHSCSLSVVPAPSLSFLFPFCRSCSPSVVPAPLLSFLRKQESSLGFCGV